MTLAALAAFPAALAYATPAPTPAPLLRYEAGKVSVRADGVPLGTILGALARETGAEIRGTIPEGTVSMAFTDEKLPDALGRLLGSQSFMLRYRADGALQAIDLLGAGPSVDPAAPLAAGVAVPTVTPGDAAERRQAATLQRSIPVEGQLVNALGSGTPSATRLLQAGLGHDDPAVRGAAQAALLDAFAADPEIERAYLGTLTPVEDAVLVRILRGMSKDDGAEQFMRVLARRAPSRELREKAGRIVAAMEGGAAEDAGAAAGPAPGAEPDHGSEVSEVVDDPAAEIVDDRAADDEVLGDPAADDPGLP